MGIERFERSAAVERLELLKERGISMPDLRTWLNEVDKLGQLMTVDNVHWDLELSTLTEIINERSKTRPAILFDRIRDYPQGYRVAANLVSSTERLALTLGMKAGLSDIDFIQAWRRQVKTIAPVTAETVATGPALRKRRRRAKTSTCSSFRCRAGMSWTADVTSAPTIW